VPAPTADLLRHAGVAARHDGTALRFEDPWANTIEVGRAERTPTAAP
jgi:hypothetical protein